MEMYRTNRDKIRDFIARKEFLIHEDMFIDSSNTYLGFNNYRGKYYQFINLHNEINGYIELLENLVGIDNDLFLLDKINVKYLINYILFFVINKIISFVNDLKDDDSEVSGNANLLYQTLEGEEIELKRETIENCSSLLVDLIQNIIEEENDVKYIHLNKDLDYFNQRLGKQKDREKQYLVSELTSQTNEKKN